MFYANNHYRDKLSSKCKDCMKEINALKSSHEHQTTISIDDIGIVFGNLDIKGLLSELCHNATVSSKTPIKPNVEITHQVCSVCEIDKEKDKFYTNKHLKTGVYRICKLCWNK